MELVQQVTIDGVKLNGVLHPPSKIAENGRSESVSDAIESESSFDAALLMHGVGSNFYQSRFFQQLTPTLTQLGLRVLWANNRGHDAIYYASKNGVRTILGSAVEIVSECVHDIKAWVEFLESRNCKRIVLIGHSLGAIKSIFALGQQPIESVKALVAASAPSLSFKRLSNGERSADFMKWILQARDMISKGESEKLMHVNFPVPMWISVAAYLDKYGAEKYDILEFVDQISCQTLLVYGENELKDGGIAFAELDAELTKKLSGRDNFGIEIIPNADHFYSGVMDVFSSRVHKWLVEPRYAD